jgi:hypothetical protein
LTCRVSLATCFLPLAVACGPSEALARAIGITIMANTAPASSP